MSAPAPNARSTDDQGSQLLVRRQGGGELTDPPPPGQVQHVVLLRTGEGDYRDGTSARW